MGPKERTWAWGWTTSHPLPWLRLFFAVGGVNPEPQLLSWVSGATAPADSIEDGGLPGPHRASDPDVESAEEVGGLSDHVLKVSKTQFAIAVQVSLLNDLVTHQHHLILIQL